MTATASTVSMYRERLATLLLFVDLSDLSDMLTTMRLMDSITMREENREGPDHTLATKVRQLIKDTDEGDGESLAAFFGSLARYTPFVNVVASYNGYVPIL